MNDIFRPNDPSNGEHPKETVVRVSVSEASRLFGVHQRTIRRAITDGKIRYIVVRGRYRLHFGSLIKWSQEQSTVRNKRDNNGIGQWVDTWKIKNQKFSPRPPAKSNLQSE
ncbi:MAG: helix-turn-helix domain-containing protein [bacterium]|nr:helix-turn-helix domain-containing protein [bacterium]